MRPYVIWAPGYDPKSGGIMVLHNFCHELNKVGQEAYIYPADNLNRNETLNTPYYTQTLEDPIAVYPEIVFGNPIPGCRTTVRWLLNNAGKLSGPKEFPTTDYLFAFSHMFNSFNLPEERIMFLPIIDTKIYKDLGKERDKTLFYVGKGWKSLADWSPTVGATEINNQTGLNPYNLASLLQTAKVLYCYDNITAMTELARLCGCPVVLMPNGEYTEEQYQQHEMGMDGLGWGKVPEPFNSQKFMERYKSLKDLFYVKLDHFIAVTQER